MKDAEAKENLQEAEFNFKVDLKTLIHKTSDDPIQLQVKICLHNNQKEGDPEEFILVSSERTERFGFLFAGDKIVVPEELEEQVVERLRFDRKRWPKVTYSGGPGWESILKTSVVHALDARVPVETYTNKHRRQKKSNYQFWPNLKKENNLICPVNYIMNMYLANRAFLLELIAKVHNPQFGYVYPPKRKNSSHSWKVSFTYMESQRKKSYWGSSFKSQD